MKLSLLSTLHALLTLPRRALRWMMLTRPIRFTRFGIFYILFTIGVGAAAINTGNNLLHLILGLLLGFIIVSGFLSDSCLWGLDADWQSTGSGYAGQPILFECRLRKGWFPAVAVTLRAVWEGAAASVLFVPWVSARGQGLFQVSLIPERRGWLSLGAVHYQTRFPFGLFEKSHTQKRIDRWLVYPRLRRLSQRVLARNGQEALRPVSMRPGPGVVPFLLRDLRAGDPARLVHWKLSAKRQRLIVKEMEDETSGGDLLVLPSWPKGLSAEAREDLISFIASAAFTLYEQARAVGLVTPDVFFQPDHSRASIHRTLRYLALVNPDESTASASLTPALSLPRHYDSAGPPETQWRKGRGCRVRDGFRSIDVLTLWKEERGIYDTRR